MVLTDMVRKFVKTILTTTAFNTRQEPKMTMTLAKRPVEMCTKPYLSFRGGSKETRPRIVRINLTKQLG